MAKWAYERGLQQVGPGAYAYLQPDGSWGWSNAGLIADGDQSLLVDTLFQLSLTEQMLAAMADAVPAARSIDTLVNTHADADHIFGNQLVKSAHIVASQAAAGEFLKVTPEDYGRIFENWQELGAGARYIHDCLGNEGFQFNDIVLTQPHETFVKEKRLKVGDKNVVLTAVGPAHTSGDVLVHAVEDRVVYTGDLLFSGAHPVLWEGSLEGWVAACDHILSLDIDVVVPGHGPLTDKTRVAEFRAYLLWFRDEVRKRFEAGLAIEETALEIVELPDLPEWNTPERIIGAVNFLYRKYGSPQATSNFLEIFGLFDRFLAKRAARTVKHDACNHGH
ncbi:MBL fold metallo-hydrolase [Sphingobium aromaticivastans]|jgi:glyoxylase-like metal-dependent hydrolase (beta-lactamase superfamily II)|uniref:MBL fold metallo-hydrolase n=1 Tax=Sphingobium aromaticivastans TaxID=1778665 RepID=UPI003018F20D